jgi:inorganic pyrophosphatase
MSELLANDEFWQSIDELVATCKVVVDRPQWSSHPRYPEMIYPLDYGYLEGSTSGDGNEIDVWIGSLTGTQVVGVTVTVDLVKLDTEVKILIGLTDDEIDTVYGFHNDGPMSAVVLMRPSIGDDE